MRFNLKSTPSLCETCVYAMINDKITCLVYNPNRIIPAPLNDCNRHTTFLQANAPYSMNQIAWEIDIKKGVFGFKPPENRNK